MEERQWLNTDTFFCRVGRFHWSLSLDGRCPNHGSEDRQGVAKGTSHALSGEDGPYNPETEAPYLDCCSEPAPLGTDLGAARVLDALKMTTVPWHLDEEVA